MNIFYLDHDPVTCAKQHCDKHVVKMILEYAQLLSTAHRVLDGVKYYEPSRRSGRMVKRFHLDGNRSKLYHATHMHHPSAVWCRETISNYIWLSDLFNALLDEYTYRYEKVHKCAELKSLLMEAPDNINLGVFTPPTLAMPQENKVSDCNIECYRDYYHTKHFAKWTNRPIPEWFHG